MNEYDKAPEHDYEIKAGKLNLVDLGLGEDEGLYPPEMRKRMKRILDIARIRRVRGDKRPIEFHAMMFKPRMLEAEELANMPFLSDEIPLINAGTMNDKEYSEEQDYGENIGEEDMQYNEEYSEEEEEE
jgi:hypothetical protein